MWRHLVDRQQTLGLQLLVCALTDRRENARTDVVRVLPRSVARRERRLALAARICRPLLCQASAQRRHDRDVALACIGLRCRSRYAKAATRNVEVRAIEPAELRDAQAAKISVSMTTRRGTSLRFR